MMYEAIPMCLMCGEREMQLSDGTCSTECSDAMSTAFDDCEPEGSYDLWDDGDALASAGFGTDEDYGYYGDDYGCLGDEY
jgi:hypothetical protein